MYFRITTIQDKLTRVFYHIVLICCFGFLCFKNTGAQSVELRNYVDSLQIELTKQHDDSTELWNLLTLSHRFFSFNKDSAKLYSTIGLTKAKEIENTYFEAVFTFRKAVEQEERDVDKSIELHRKAARLYESLGKKPFESYATLAALFQENLQIDSVLLYSQKTLDYLPAGADNWKAYILSIIELTYENLGLYEQALTYQRRILKIPNAQLWSLASLGALFQRTNQLDSAEYYLLKTYERRDELDIGRQITLLNFLAENYRLKGLRKEADRYNRMAWEQTNQVDGKDKPILFLDQANYLNQSGNHIEALRVSQLALALLDTFNRAGNVITAYEEMAIAYEGLQQLDSALVIQKKIIEHNKTLYSDENSRLLQKYEVEHRTLEKEQELLKNQEVLASRARWLWIAALLILSISAICFYLYYFLQKRLKINESLKKLDRAKSNFFTNISHELRTPLTLILGPLEQLLKEENPLKAKETIELAHNNGKKLLGLTNEILDLSKLESGQLSLNESTVNLEQVLRRIFFGFHSLAQINEFILSFSYHLPQHLWIYVDEDKFERVLNNLISNAFKHSKPGGVITLRASMVEKSIQIEVADTGTGIPLEEQEKIFDRYYQVSSNEAQLAGGSGIGLAFVQEIANLFDGNISVDSEVDKGSTFRFSFPLKKAVKEEHVAEYSPVDVHENQVVPAAPSKNGSGLPTILIVEDNPEMSKYLKSLLTDEYRCLTASDGRKALELLEKNEKSIDLITSDVMMPHMDGFSLLKNVRSNASFASIPVILLTARSLEADKLKAFNLGVDDYLTKPFAAKELLARVRNLINNNDRRKEFAMESLSPKAIEQDNFDQELLKKAQQIVELNIAKTEFKISELSQEMNYSQRQLARIIKKLTGLSPVAFVREIRLLKAQQLIEARIYPTIAEVRFEVGIENASYFSKKFNERFGINPKEYLDRIKNR